MMATSSSASPSASTPPSSGPPSSGALATHANASANAERGATMPPPAPHLFSMRVVSLDHYMQPRPAPASDASFHTEGSADARRRDGRGAPHAHQQLVEGSILRVYGITPGQRCCARAAFPYLFARCEQHAAFHPPQACSLCGSGSGRSGGTERYMQFCGSLVPWPSVSRRACTRCCCVAAAAGANEVPTRAVGSGGDGAGAGAGGVDAVRSAQCRCGCRIWLAPGRPRWRGRNCATCTG